MASWFDSNRASRHELGINVTASSSLLKTITIWGRNYYNPMLKIHLYIIKNLVASMLKRPETVIKFNRNPIDYQSILRHLNIILAAQFLFYLMNVSERSSRSFVLYRSIA